MHGHYNYYRTNYQNSYIRCTVATLVYTVEPPIMDTPNKGRNTNNLRIKDKLQCTKWRLSYSSNTFLTSDKGQPLNNGQNGQKTMGPKRVRYSEVPL